MRKTIELLMKLINSIFTICGLGFGFYGIYCLTKWNQDLSHITTYTHTNYDVSNWLSDKLPKPWFIYLVLTIGASLIVISCFGWVGAATRSPCCLCFYSIILVVLFVAQLGAAALMFFNRNWKQDMPHDMSGRFNSTLKYLSKNWNIIRWIILGAFILEVIAVTLALWLRCANTAKFRSEGYERVVARPNTKPAPPTSSKLQTSPTTIKV
ncbi:tobamovirus multiplication 2A [Euphorbia peplus]|nr:tobamovirus multiplication 2A [Euphorbia peplus]